MFKAKTPNHHNLAIQKSPIHGYGIFARKSFKRGDYIGTVHGSKVVYKSLFQGQSNRYEDWIGLGKDTWIDPVDEFKYVNHSCDPNAGIKGSNVLQAFAIRDISEGEEVTIDYSTIEADEGYVFENHENKHEKFRQFVGPIQSLPQQTYESYLPFIPDYFRKIYKHKVLSKHGKGTTW